MPCRFPMNRQDIAGTAPYRLANFAGHKRNECIYQRIYAVTHTWHGTCYVVIAKNTNRFSGVISDATT
jgi:hypothetical protein